MSLVICSNQEKDGVALRQQQSVYNAWSFRNPLSSTMTIPANAQVALQSCKVNVDGRVAFTNNNSKFYHYFGEKLPLTSTADQNSTSVPVITQLTNENESSDVVELSNEEFALRIQEQIRTTSYHPNTKGQFECAVLRNGSSRDFLGYKYSFKQKTSNTNSIPADNTFRRFFSEFQDLNASYTSGIFQRNASVNDTSAGINIQQPFSLTNGSFIVNLSGTNAAAIIYDVSNRESFKKCADWIRELRHENIDLDITIVGNKTDIEREVQRNDAERIARRLGCRYVETSALTGEGVADLVKTLIENAIQDQNNKRRAIGR